MYVHGGIVIISSVVAALDTCSCAALLGCLLVFSFILIYIFFFFYCLLSFLW